MSASLVSPGDAANRLAQRLRMTWADRIVAERSGADQPLIEISLRPGVLGHAAVERLGFGAWTDWYIAWTEMRTAYYEAMRVSTHPASTDRVSGAEYREIRVAGLTTQAPFRLRFESLYDAELFLKCVDGIPLSLPLTRARAAAAELDACGVNVTPQQLKALCRLPDDDSATVLAAVAWLNVHADLSTFTARQIPVAGMHSKWWQQHIPLLSGLTGRDLEREMRPRLAVVHVTYVDPVYLATGQRRHDAWTTGDTHDLPYRPSTVLIVENRDNRLWFLPEPDTVVVEGGGKAAGALLSEIAWIREADHVVYWGDIDSDGFIILSHLRRELERTETQLVSMLMDEEACAKYGSLGVNIDANGRPLLPVASTPEHLRANEAAAFAHIATHGPAPFRRIEQERIPLEDARAALRSARDAK